LLSAEDSSSSGGVSAEEAKVILVKCLERRAE